MLDLIYAVLVLVSLLVTVQSAHTLYLTLYTWDRPPAEARAPDQFKPPGLSFTVMLPARQEEDVIQATIGRVAESNYPQDLIQVLVICRADDQGTIDKAEEKISELRRHGLRNVEMVVFRDEPINKPHGLNAALPHAAKDVLAIFDAEDDIHPDIFNVVNTVMEEEEVKVVQGGVQLMNFNSSWYSALNVLEYFFWFKSRLHYHARLGAIPLGGNTVFFDREPYRRPRRLGRAQPDRGCGDRAAPVGCWRADPRRIRQPLRDQGGDTADARALHPSAHPLEPGIHANPAAREPGGACTTRRSASWPSTPWLSRRPRLCSASTSLLAGDDVLLQDPGAGRPHLVPAGHDAAGILPDLHGRPVRVHRGIRPESISRRGHRHGLRVDPLPANFWPTPRCVRSAARCGASATGRKHGTSARTASKWHTGPTA